MRPDSGTKRKETKIKTEWDVFFCLLTIILEIFFNYYIFHKNPPHLIFISELTSTVPQGGYGEFIYQVSSLWEPK